MFPVVSMVDTLVAIVALDAETDGHSSAVNPLSTNSASIKKIVTLKKSKNSQIDLLTNVAVFFNICELVT